MSDLSSSILHEEETPNPALSPPSPAGYAVNVKYCGEQLYLNPNYDSTSHTLMMVSGKKKRKSDSVRQRHRAKRLGGFQRGRPPKLKIFLLPQKFLRKK